jgi:hypothetical protein
MFRMGSVFEAARSASGLPEPFKPCKPFVLIKFGDSSTARMFVLIRKSGANNGKSVPHLAPELRPMEQQEKLVAANEWAGR